MKFIPRGRAVNRDIREMQERRRSRVNNRGCGPFARRGLKSAACEKDRCKGCYKLDCPCACHSAVGKGKQVL